MRPGATIGIVFGLLWVGGPVETVAQGPEELITLTSDGVTLHGERYFGDLDAAAPLILLFHQGASSGRGEYSPLIPWLNGAGFRAIAWDQRAGGDRHGEDNRTAAGLEEGVPSGYCDAYPDLQAALDFVIEAGLARQVVIWGSSYSGALVFRLAAENRDRVSGVVAFSPAAGGPMVDCQGRRWLDEVTAPMLVYRPRSEMEIESSQEQRDIFTAAGASFIVVENGVHGSSMLIDARTGQDMSATRGALIEWLKREGAAAPGTAQPPASGLQMVEVPGGTFQMGGTDVADDGARSELRLADECPHPVSVNSFSIARYEVTVADWRAVMGSVPAGTRACDQCPIANVSWNNIQEFLRRPNQGSGERYRLPTEEEWEFAARRGSYSHRAESSRVRNLNARDPDQRLPTLGFRLAM